MKELVPLLVGIPLGAAFLITILAHVRGISRLTGLIATLAVAANVAVSIALWVAAYNDPGQSVSVWAGNWDGLGVPIGIEMVCDGLARLMVITINIIAFVVIIFAASYMLRFTKVWLFYSLFLLMTGALNGVVLAGDLFNMFVFIEVATIASYGLVGFGCEAEELEAAFKYLVLGTIGSCFILLGVTILYSLTGHLNMAMVASLLPKVGSQGPAVLLAAAALLGGLSLKAAMVPFHAWLPDAHPSAPAPISAMLSGVLIKACGVYCLARLMFNVFGTSGEYAMILIVLGAASMVIGVFLAVGQWDFKRLLAYHSISQMGYVVLAIGVAGEVISRAEPDQAIAALCLFGGLFHMFNHAAFKSLLFLSSGSIEQQTGTRRLKEMGGLARRMPVTSFCCRIGALSIAGVPPFNGFFSKLIIIVALVLAGHPFLAALAVLVALMTLLSFIKVQRYALEGEPVGKAVAAREAPALMGLAMLLLAVVCIVAGLAMVPLREYLFGPAGEVLLKGSGALKAKLSTGVSWQEPLMWFVGAAP
ncbi:MAG: proton-conducting transporter membrane subunit [Planctomycetota bacterium]|nr:proton-conducting transporter membrane subunit [Planctomycetota bacterium]